ncbi:hypothetical protein GWK90_05125 [Candidatus Hamiltonella defensa]|nr:hypothetical protein [Candidatus Hamiltonella defensa]
MKVITIDKSGANTAALTEINKGKSQGEAIKIRQIKYLNNLIEQVKRNYETPNTTHAAILPLGELRQGSQGLN